MITPEKSISGIAGEQRKMKGSSFMIILAPGLRAAWLIRTRTCVGDVMAGMGICVRERTAECGPALVCVHACILLRLLKGTSVSPDGIY